ncbi:hypothetical protein GCM10009785_11180 [Brooklawnia cerclae]|uniref:Uncharacterized protein n=1 Tax=Brooklawnia cerclae TaxID=349934 RepID=A0ABX0SJU8_9ACTN|nr:DUF6541 family protein [Brooklawnia cerclae]NIH58653.1 hypothetical protein [Brooklawnia cerclae]
MWWALLPFVLVALAVVLLPGLAVNLSAGFRPLVALAVAPAVSTGIVASAAILAQFVGVPWGPLPVVVWTLFFALVALGLRVGLRRIRGIDTNAEGTQASAQPAPRWWARPTTWVLVAAVLSITVLCRDVIAMLGTPTAFSQTYDNIFHLNAVRWIIDNHNGSAIDMRMVSGDAPAAFYPTAWHDLASLVLLSMGSQNVVAGMNATIVAVVGVVWPLGCLFLSRMVLEHTPAGTLTTGILAASFAPFPYFMLAFGVLYPNLLGLCLLPTMMGLAVGLFRLGEGKHLPLLPTLTAGGIGLVGLGLAHPNVVLVYCGVVIPIMTWTLGLRVVRESWRAREFGRRFVCALIALLGITLVATALYVVLRPAHEAAFWEPVKSRTDAIGEALLMSPLDLPTFILPALMTLIGLYAVLRTGRHTWLLVAHGAFCVLWFIAATQPVGRLRWYLVGPWYSDPPRLASLLPLTAIPLAAFGAQFLESKLVALLPSGEDATTMRRRLLVGVLLAAVLAVGTQFSGAKQKTIELVKDEYSITGDSELVNSDEYAVIQAVPGIVPPDEVIAVNPYNGSSMVYALTGRRTTATHVLYAPTPDQEILIEDLDEASNNERVCQALIDLDVHWVLDFGNDDLINEMDYPYLGFDNLANNQGFVARAASGHATLYEITACGLG